MSLSVEVETGRRERALVVPVSALRGDDAAAANAEPSTNGMVWLALDGRVQARPLKLGLRTLDAVEVLQGLAAGDTVLLGTAPPPGSRVRMNAAATPAGAAAVAAVAKKGSGDNAGAAMSNAMGR